MKINKKVVVCSRSFSKNQFLRSKLYCEYQDIKFNDDGLTLSGATLVDFIKGYEEAIIGLEVINNDILSLLPELKVIGKYGVGLDKLDLDALDENEVLLGWKPGVNSQAVAELTLNLCLSIIRKTNISNIIVKNDQWFQVVGRELSSMTVGILGCGHVGTQFLKLLSGFDCEVLICDIEDKSSLCKKYKAQQVSLEELYSLSNLISIHLPLNHSTINIFNKSSIKLMKQPAYVVNTARGRLVNEDDLITALDDGTILGAGLDVLETEPPKSMSLICHENCMITPHIGGSSEEAIKKMGLAAIEGLKNPKRATLFKNFY